MDSPTSYSWMNLVLSTFMFEWFQLDDSKSLLSKKITAHTPISHTPVAIPRSPTIKKNPFKPVGKGFSGVCSSSVCWNHFRSSTFQAMNQPSKLWISKVFGAKKRPKGKYICKTKKWTTRPANVESFCRTLRQNVLTTISTRNDFQKQHLRQVLVPFSQEISTNMVPATDALPRKNESSRFAFKISTL